MQSSSFTTRVLCTTALALPLIAAPATVKLVSQGWQVGPAQAWADSDHGDGHDSGGDSGNGGDHGSSGGDSGNGGDHGSSSGGGGSDDGGNDADGAADSSHGDRGHDQTADQDHSSSQGGLERERETWLGVPEREQGASATSRGNDDLTPVPAAQERQLLESGWASDDAQGDDR